MASLLPKHTVGVGLRSPHTEQIITEKPDIGWLEIHSENYFAPHSIAKRHLLELRQHYPISCHGIGLSLGSADPLNFDHLRQLKQLVHDIEPFLISEHLSWSSINGQYFNDLLPLPYTEEALSHFCQRVEQVQEFLGHTILIENPSSYLSYRHSTISEWEFLTQVQQRTDCGLLLDLNNIYVSAFNHGFSAETYLAAIDPKTVHEIHLAGFTVKHLPQGEIWIDTHSRPVASEVWQLYQTWIEQHAMTTPTLIEWDSDIPELEVLLNEAAKATALLQHNSSRTLAQGSVQQGRDYDQAS